MIESQKISGRQMFWVIMAATYGGAVYLQSHFYKMTGGAAVPLAFLIATVITIVLALTIWDISKHFPGKTIIQIMEIYTGKVIGKICSTIYILIAMALAVFHLRLFAALVGTFILVKTPIWVNVLIILLVSLYISTKGVEVQARLFTLTVVASNMLLLISFILCYISQFDLSNLLPIFDTGRSQFMKGTYLIACEGGGESIFAVLLYIASLRKPSSSKKGMILTIIFILFILPSIAAITFIGTLGFELTSRIGYAGLNAVLAVGIGEFIQGMEIFLLFTYELFAIMKTSIYTYSAWITGSHLLNDRFRWIILSTSGIVIYIGTLNIDSFNKAYFYYEKLAGYVLFPFVTLTIIVTWILVMVGKKKGKHCLNQD